MQIRIEIDVRPDELRRFLGLPDVAGLQDDVIAFLRDKVNAAGDFDPAHFVKHNIDSVRKTPAWQKLIAKVRMAEAVDEIAAAIMNASIPDPEPAPVTPKARKRTAATKTRSRRTKTAG